MIPAPTLDHSDIPTYSGRIMESKKCGPFEVIDKAAGIWTIQFLETGTIIPVVSTYASNGSVTDPYARTVAGIGFLGEGPHGTRITDQSGSKVQSPAYKLWANMLQRCYVDPANGKRPTYVTCTVHKDWHDFQNFCDDIRTLEGYDMWAEYQAGLGGEKIELDKDVLCEGMDVKEYGPETCLFLTKSDNLKAMWASRRARA
ncbi:MAG: hypothetical protein ACRCTP_17730 [Aeromonas popoffii]|uniref:hypothetical protein n=1 Tax=Aeromonas popoffii TaxID=70856 RepID=UPI003F3D9187